MPRWQHLRETTQDGFEEPSAKRQKMTISAIGRFQFPHVDDTEATMGVDFDFEVFSEWPMDEAEDTHDTEYQKGGDDEEQLWFPLTAEEPSLGRINAG